MVWRGKKFTAIEAEELYLTYHDYEFFPPEGTIALEFWNSDDYLDNVEGFWDYVAGVILSNQGREACADFKRSVSNF
jgi:hypothetical protein